MPHLRWTGGKFAIIAAAAAAIGALALPPPAHAELRTIAFDDLPNGTQVTTQYQGQGATFGGAGFPGTLPPQACGGAPTARDAFGRAFSPFNVAQAAQCSSSEFPYSGIVVHLPRSRSVALRAGTISSFPRDVRLEAYNGAGGLVGVQDATVGSSASTPLGVASAAANIEWVAVFYKNATGSGEYLEIDNLDFDALVVGEPPPPPAQPDFLLAPAEPGRVFAITPGSSSTTTIVVRRLSGSTGRIGFAAGTGGRAGSGLPPGVIASFVPQPFTGGDGGGVRVTLSAAPNAPAASNVPVTVTATPQDASAGSAPRSAELLVSVRPPGFDLRARGLEVTQAIQPGGSFDVLPSSAPGAGPRSFRYAGVPLAYGHRTLVRLYPDAQGARPSVSGVDALLYGYDGAGRPLPGSPLLPDDGEHTVFEHSSRLISYGERSDPEAPFPFTLPRSWTGGSLRLRAVLSSRPVFFDESRPTECRSAACAENNSTELTGIAFRGVRNEGITPVHLEYRGAPRPDPSGVFEGARAVMPIGIITPPYRGEINVDDIVYSDYPGKDGRDDRSSEILDRLEDWQDDRAETGTVVVGIAGRMYNSAPPANAGPCVDNPATDAKDCTDSAMASGLDPVGFGSNQPYAVVNDQRPLDSVAHELGHTLGRKHASPACGGDKDGFDPWPPDQLGEIHGMGVDTRPGSGGRGPFRVFSDPHVDDYMSYCNDAGLWTSVEGWTNLATRYRALRLAAAPPSASAAAPADSALRVAGVVTATGPRITRVRPSRAGVLEGPADSPFRLVARGSTGQPLVEVPMVVAKSHVDGGGNVTRFSAKVPRAGVTAVDVVMAGAVIARRARSPHAPRVRVLSPRGGSRVGGRRGVTLRWRATDADRDRLSARIDYSRDGGRHWVPIFAGPSTGATNLPSRLLGAARRARVRVQISDGFNESTAVSGVFAALGAPPAVVISSPVRRARVPADASLYLSGAAFDDAFRRLRGRSLSWYEDRRLLGRGEQVSVTGLRPGLRRVRLVARDRFGRRGSAAVAVRVLAATPRFLTASGPRVLSRRARAARLRVASSIPAVLRVAGRRVAVGRRPVVIVVPVTRGTRRLAIRLDLRAGARRALRTVLIARR